MDWVAAETAAWSQGLGGIRAAPLAALLFVVGGFLWLALWRERWRLAGLVPMALAVPVMMLAPRPDILVAAGGTAAAVRGDDGRYRIVGGKGASFEVENWLRADADPRMVRDTSLGDGVTCDASMCVDKAAFGWVAVVFDVKALVEACRTAAVIVSRFRAPPDCARTAIVLDRTVLEKGGSAALCRVDETSTGPPRFRMETAYPAIRRPFMPPLPTPYKRS
jgi:competence protein ComEC